MKTFQEKLVELEHSNTIRGVEIFATGKHNGQEFTEKDIDDIIAAFKELDFKPALKIGHTAHKKGAPAFGWITNLTKVAKDGAVKLMADFESMHDSVVSAIRSKQYDRVSSEIYMNFERAGKTFRRALRAVALLGAEVPAVANLKPLHQIEFEEPSGAEVYSDEASELDVPMQASFAALETRIAGLVQLFMENDDMAKKNAALLAQLKGELEEFRVKMKKMPEDDEKKEMAKKCSDLESRIAQLEAEDNTDDETAKALEAANKRIAELEAKDRAREVEKRVDRCTVPALKPSLKGLFTLAINQPEGKVMVFDAEAKKEVEKPLIAVVESFVDAINDQAAKLFKQVTSAGGDIDEGGDKLASIELDEKATALLDDAKKPASVKSYSDATKHILKTDSELARRYQEELDAGNSAKSNRRASAH